jgi:hypothetical protein
MNLKEKMLDPRVFQSLRVPWGTFKPIKGQETNPFKTFKISEPYPFEINFEMS